MPPRPGSDVVRPDIVSDSAPVEVADRSLSRTVQPLDLALMRLRPDPRDHMIATDGIHVPRAQRALVTDLIRDGDEIGQLRWIAFPAPPPQMQNMEGEPLLLVTATYRLLDPAAARDALGRSLRDDGDDVFTETVIRRGREWTRGTIRIEGDIATIDTNSTKRANRLVRHLLKAAPGSRLIKRAERGLDEALAEPLGRAGAADEEGATEGVGAAGASILDPAEHSELQAALDARPASWLAAQNDTGRLATSPSTRLLSCWHDTNAGFPDRGPDATPAPRGAPPACVPCGGHPRRGGSRGARRG